MLSYGQNAKVTLFFDKPYFYVGEFVRGTIEINTNALISISGILIEIILTEHWKLNDSSNDYDKTLTDAKTIVTYNLDLKCLAKYKTNNNKYLLPYGVTLVPFNFRFSEENNPSFEYPLPGKRDFLRYNFRVNVKSPNISGNSSYYLCLISRPIIQSEKLLTKSINQHIKKWKIFDKGDTILKISIPENNFKYDSKCDVTIEIDNTNGKVATKEYKIMLIRKTIFKNKMGEIKGNDITNIVSERVRAIVEPKKKEIFEYNLILKEKEINKKYNYLMETNPYDIEMNKINFYMPTINGSIISCNYEIKVSVYFNFFVAYDDRPRIIMPIYIVHQLPYDYQLEIQEQIDYENALQKSMFDNANQKHKEKIENKNNYQNKDLNNKIYNKSLDKNNDDINFNEEEDESLPSLEAIEEAKKNRNYNNNDIIENKKNNNSIIESMNDININEKNEYDNCPPPLFESAPVPFGFEDPNFKYEKNKAYPVYNPDNFNENGNDNYTKNKNIININQIDNTNDSNNNLIINNNIIPKESPEDFSLFDSGNNSDYIK